MTDPVSPTPPAPADIEAAVRGAGDDREALEALRAGFQARIARRSDDFEASRGLKAVEAALNETTREGDPWDRAVRKLLRH